LVHVPGLDACGNDRHAERDRGCGLFYADLPDRVSLLGPEYPHASPVAAIGVALLTEIFGFSSGFVGYFRKKLIDIRVARALMIYSVPVGIGEVVIPLLGKRYRFPVSVVAATLILVVIVTVMSAPFTHISTLIAEGGVDAVL